MKKKIPLIQIIMAITALLFIVFFISAIVAIPTNVKTKMYAITYFDGNESYTDFADSIFTQTEHCIDYQAWPLHQRKKVCGQNIVVTDYSQE